MTSSNLDRLSDADPLFYREEGLRREVFDRVHREPVTFFSDHVDEDRTDWLFFGT